MLFDQHLLVVFIVGAHNCVCVCISVRGYRHWSELIRTEFYLKIPCIKFPPLNIRSVLWWNELNLELRLFG